MSVSSSVQQPGNNDEERQGSSPYFPKISGANTVARPSPMQTATEEGFPTVKLQAKMVKQTPLPYQTQEFRPCIVLKKFEPSVRVSDSFVPGIAADELLGEFKKKRTVILHTDRYSHHGQMKLDSDSQKLRLAQEGQMLQDARSRMRLREALAHRARHDLHLGGSPLAAPAAASAGDAANQATTEQNNQKLAKKLSHRKRLRAEKQQQQQQQQHQSVKLGFIPEDSAEFGRRLDRRDAANSQQNVSHSSFNPSQQNHQQQRPMLHGGFGAAGQSFATRSEFDALAALISADAASQELQGVGAAGTAASSSSGLEKVKLDGSKAVFNRRSDILTEIARLKAIVLPDFAKDLYVGRGIRLPESHALNNPKKTLGADDPILEALLHRAQQPSRIIDESGNILIASDGVGGGSQQQQPKRQVFAADVTVKPTIAKQNELTPPAQEQPELDQQTQLESLEEEQQQQQQQQADQQPSDEEPIEHLPEPFLGLPNEWMRSEAEAADNDKNHETDETKNNVQELIKQQELPQILTSYLSAILNASNHARAGQLTLELGRLISRRLNQSSDFQSKTGSSASLIGWLRRGLDLFHDVDREVKGSVSLIAFLDILSSMRGMPLDNQEISRMQSDFGLSSESVSKLAFLSVLPFLQDTLNKQA